MKKDNRIQLLRGIAILAIILIHTCPRGPARILIRPFLNYGVALFLFLSGYLTQIKDGSLFSFYKKTIIRVLFPYVIWTIVYTLLFQDYSRIPFNLITARTSAHFYFIPVYIQFVLLTPLIIKLAHTRYRWAGWIIAPLASLLFIYLPAISHQELPDKVAIVWNICCLGWFTFYYLGIYLRANDRENPPTTNRLGFFLSCAILLQIAEGFLLQHLNYFDPGIQLKFSALLTNSIILVICYHWLHKPQQEPGDRNLFVITGNYSFGIYLTHLMIQTFLFNITGFSAIPFPITSAIVFILSFALVFILGQICGKSFSRILGLQ